MNDLSDNRFIAELCGKDEITLNSFLFNGRVEKNQVDCKRFYQCIYGLLATLCFNVHLSGYKYLAGLTVMYLVNDSYNEIDAYSALSDYYGIGENDVAACIAESINVNTNFISSASHILNNQLYPRDCKYVHDVLEIIGAVFKITYNFTVDEDEINRIKSSVVPIQG